MQHQIQHNSISGIVPIIKYYVIQISPVLLSPVHMNSIIFNYAETLLLFSSKSEVLGLSKSLLAKVNVYASLQCLILCRCSTMLSRWLTTFPLSSKRMPRETCKHFTLIYYWELIITVWPHTKPAQSCLHKEL